MQSQMYQAPEAGNAPTNAHVAASGTRYARSCSIQVKMQVWQNVTTSSRFTVEGLQKPSFSFIGGDGDPFVSYTHIRVPDTVDSLES